MPESPSQGVAIHDAASGKSLSVRSLRVLSVVDGPFSSTTFTITFNNDLGGDGPLEGDLVFPLPPFASLKSLKAKVGNREIEGQFKPRDRAQADYDRAKQAGQTAALGESEGEDLARLRISPIEKGEDVEVAIEVVQPLAPTPDGHKLILATTYMPRYTETGSILNSTEQAAGDRPRPLTLAARANIEVRIKSISGKLPTVSCATHPSKIAEEDGQIVVRVSGEPLDRDMIVGIADKCEGADPLVWVRYDSSDGPDSRGPSTALAIIPPKFADEGPTTPRDVVFLVDRSGSMGEQKNGPMTAAKRAVKGCLRALGPNDRFNIISFDTQIESLAPTSVEFSADTLAKADAFVDALEARGGTEASAAIVAALSGRAADHNQVVMEGAAPDPNLRLRIVVMLTDGAVGSAQHTLQQFRDKLHDTRFFCLGIGDGVSHATLASLAAEGRGTYIPAGTDVEGIEDVVSKLKSSIDAPLITGVKVRIDEDGQVRDAPQLESAGAIDLFAAESLLMAFRGPVKPGAVLIVSGQRSNGEDFRFRAPIRPAGEAPEAPDAVASIIWAMLRNKNLTYRFNSADDATLEEMGVAFGLVNRCTALIGVHAEQRGLKAPETVPVVLPMPRNIAQANQGGNDLAMRMIARAPIAFAAAATPGSYSHSATLGGSLTRSATMRGGSALESMTLGSLELERSVAPSPISEEDSSIYTRGFSMPRVTKLDLRTLMLKQDADGMFGSLVATLVAVAAFAKQGHTARSGNFRAELRRTMAKVGSLPAPALSALEVQIAALTLAILRGEKGADELAGNKLLFTNLGQAILCDAQATQVYDDFIK